MMFVKFEETLETVFSTIHGSLCLTIVFLFTVLLIFVRRVNTMIDMVANRVFDAYSRLTPGDEIQSDTLSTLNRLKRFSNDSKQRRLHEREMDIKAREKHLVDIKENQMYVPQLKKRPLMGLGCHNCTPASRQSLISKATQSVSLIDILSHDPFRSRKGFIQRTFNHLAQVGSCKKYDFPKVEGTVIKDERLLRAIEKSADEQFHDADSCDENFYRSLIKHNEKRAKKILHDMRSTLSHFLLSFTNWVMYKLLPCFMSSIVVHPGQIEMLKKASDSGLPLIFIPLHKSHLDYILVTFILLNNNIKSPLVAAGDNLRIPFFGSLLRGLGAFFIRRRMDPVQGRKDHIYKAVLHTYMNECLRAGHNIEFFLEGGRTRTGKPCMPKYGIVSVIIDAFMDGTIEDALLVPISMNYEKLIDGNFVREQLGQPKEMETFSSAIKGIWHVLNSNYGMMRIDFNQPFSLRELVKTFNSGGKIQTNGINGKKLRSHPSSNSLYGTDIVSEENKYLIQSISKHVLYDCSMSTAIMSTNAVAFLLLNKFRNGTTGIVLADALDSLRNELIMAGRDLGFTGEALDVVDYAVKLLGPGLVRTEILNNEVIIKPVSMLPNVIELAYYSNCMLQHFVLRSVVALAISPKHMEAGFITQDELVQNSLEICDILQYEFLFCKPCQSLEMTITNAVDEMMFREIFIMISSSENNISRRLQEELFEEEVTQQVAEYKINITEENVQHLKFLRDILKPWLEPYSVSALCLEKLVGTEMVEQDLVREILEEMKEQFRLGNVTYGESVCVDPVKNSLKLFERWDYLECHAEERIRLLYLKTQHDNSESMQTLHDKINKYRVVT